MIALALREEIRTLIRTQLSTRALFPATGMASIRRGTGRPCHVCDHPIDSPTLEREVEGPGATDEDIRFAYQIGLYELR